MKWDIKRDNFALIVLAVAVIIACYYYTILPQMVASHYNGNGTVGSSSARRLQAAWPEFQSTQNRSG